MNEGKPTYFDALSQLVGGSENLTGGLTDGPMSKIGFVDGVSKPEESAVQTKLTELISDFNAQDYARNRAEQFPNYAEQLDLLFHDMTAGKGTKTGEWYKAVAKVKADNPKG